jgi:hypothetical protein
MYYNPRVTDRILMSLGRQNGPAVDAYPQKVITEEAAREFAGQKQAEDVQERLNLAKLGLAMEQGLGERRLAQGAEQFGQNLEFQKQKASDLLGFERQKFDTGIRNAQDEMQSNRRLSNTAALISLGGLGVEGLRSYKTAQRGKQISAQYDSMIDFYNKQGTAESKRYADLINLLRID